MKRVRRELKGTIGLVATMGYLHEGHLSLIRQCCQDNDYTIVSIFVNPTQFGPSEDFARYPRDLPRDLALLEKENVNFVFLPQAKNMYPEEYNTWIDVGSVTERLEGALRPGHFRGVATVVFKIFNIIQPGRAYFGQKDAQQCVVLKKMVADLNNDVEIIMGATFREKDGLAMSSRNVYLSQEERRQAPIIYRALSTAHVMWVEGERDSSRLRDTIRDIVTQKPLAKIEYISIASTRNMQELENAIPPAIISLAVKFGETRLIDNVWLE